MKKPITILKASAGSGKTFQIVGFYLNLCFAHPENPYYFKHILAITFTNKATNEMRERILHEVKMLAQAPGDSPYLEDLISETGKSEDYLQKQAATLLKIMLQHYEQISVSTIDSFFQRVLRAFAQELNIDSSYQVQLKTDELIELAVDKLVRDIDKNHQLYKWLSKELQRKIDEGKKFAVNKSINALAKEIYTEEINLEDLKTLDFSLIEQLFQDLTRKKYILENENLSYIRKVMEQMEARNFTINDFSGKTRSFMSALINKESLIDLKKVVESKLLPKILVDPNKMYSNANKNRADEYLNFYNEFLEEHIEAYQSFAGRAYKEYITGKLILNELISYITLRSLVIYLTEVRRENNWMLLSETNRFLKKLMETMFIPFLYEKIAVQYRHLLIDEFQDTSEFQWYNLKPLLEENCSKGLENLIVGDVKQAIYRFRNGNWNLLKSHIEKDFSGYIETKVLGENYRSDENIISLNNELFHPQSLPTVVKCAVDKIVENYYLENEKLDTSDNYREEIIEIYEDSMQEMPRVDALREKVAGKGYVEVNFIDETALDEQTEEVLSRENLYALKLHETLLTLQKNGYQPSDIGILCKKKNKIRDFVAIIELLKANPEKYPGLKDDFLRYINNEALLLSNNSVVRYIIANFRMMVEPDEDIHLYEILHLREKDFNFKVENREIEKSEILAKYAEIEGGSLLEIAETFLNDYAHEILETHGVYIHAFLEVILDYQTEHGSYIPDFLSWWEEEEAALNLPEGEPAMEILTAHKAKGLAFPIVIMPFLDWKFQPKPIHKNILWGKYFYEDTEMNLPIDWSYAGLNSEFTGLIYREIVNSHIDTLNLFYVAMTRAKNEIYILADTPSNTDVKKLNSISAVLNKFIVEQSSTVIETEGSVGIHTYVYGEQAGREREEKTEMDTYPIYATHYRTEFPALRTIAWEEDTLGSDSEFKQDVLRGNAIHRILENIAYLDDIDSALKTAILNGIIPQDEEQTWRLHLDKLFSIPEIKNLFSRDYTVLREREIITANGRILIPDRVIFSEQEVHIIDFKSGQHQDAHKKQLDRYKKQYEEMGYVNIKTSILYTHLFELKRIA